MLQVQPNHLDSLFFRQVRKQLNVEEVVEWLPRVGNGVEVKRSGRNQHATVVAHEQLTHGSGFALLFDLPCQDFIEIFDHDEQRLAPVAYRPPDLGLEHVPYLVAILFFSEFLVEPPPNGGGSRGKRVPQDLAHAEQEVDIAEQPQRLRRAPSYDIPLRKGAITRDFHRDERQQVRFARTARTDKQAMLLGLSVQRAVKLVSHLSQHVVPAHGHLAELPRVGDAGPEQPNREGMLLVLRHNTSSTVPASGYRIRGASP